MSTKIRKTGTQVSVQETKVVFTSRKDFYASHNGGWVVRCEGERTLTLKRRVEGRIP